MAATGGQAVASDVKTCCLKQGPILARWGLMMMLVALLETAGLGQALAHHARNGWVYPPACCHGDDRSGECGRIPTDDLTETYGGWTVLLKPGDHPRVTEPHRYFIPYGDELPSGDKNYHICLHPTERDNNCFFVPPGSI